MGPYLTAAVSAAVLGPAFGNFFAQAQAQAAEGCTTNSFTYPSWLISDFESAVGENSTAASFNALNRATNTPVQYRCLSSTAGWRCAPVEETGSTVVLGFQTDESSASFSFNETWTCSDLTPDQPLTFTAVGNGSVALTCAADESGVTTCQAASPPFLLVKASLDAPVQITPAYVAGPQGHDAEGCSAESEAPSWSVTAAQLNLQKSSGAVVGGNAFIIVRNNVLGFSASCGGSFQDPSGGGPQTLTCTPQTSSRRAPKYQIETTLLLDPATFDLTVSQAWFCDDGNPAAP
ncbi:hypothetical protein VTK26DRAFT_2398 [Humicola hyalothermophila]